MEAHQISARHKCYVIF